MVMRRGYLPDQQSFESGLPSGKSIYVNKSNTGRTRRERDKQSKRAARIRARSHADKAAQGKASK